MMMALEGIRILDWTAWIQGPLGTQMLADLGAEVIKIEQPKIGDSGRGLKKVGGTIPVPSPYGRNLFFEAFNRNKKSIAIDLKKEGAKDVIQRLLRKSDVFVHNMRGGSAERLGLGYQQVSGLNPRIIYARASGYGPKGRDSAKASFDGAIQARMGVMTLIGKPGDPPLSGPGGMADTVGAIVLAYGILIGLLARERLGIGQELDVSQLGSVSYLMGLNLSLKLMAGKEGGRIERSKSQNPLYNHYRCKDGKWIYFVMSQSDRYWPTFCRAVGLDQLVSVPKFANMDSRMENCEELIAILDNNFDTKTRAEWMSILDKHDLVFEEVHDLSEVAEDPQLWENDYFLKSEHPVLGTMKMLGYPVTLSKTPGSIRLPAPELGQHTEEVLTEVGDYSWEEINQLREEGII